MRILHIDRQRGWTGQTNRTLTMVRGLRAAGVQVELVAHRAAPLARRAAEEGIDVHEMPLYGAAMFGCIVPLARLLRSSRIDVLHCHGPRDHLLCTLVKHIGRVPHFVRTRHSSRPLNSGAISRLLFKPCSAVVAVSDYVKRLSLDEGLDARIIQTIHDAVDTEKYSPRPRCEGIAAELGIQRAEFVVGHVSRLDNDKGVDILLKAFHLLCQNNPDRPFRCVLIGPESEQHMALIRKLGAGDRVSLGGHRDDVHNVLPQFDLFVFPSRREALGTAVLEAMSAGIPVIGSDAGGIPELVSQKTGLIVPVGDVEGLMRAMQHLADDAPRRRAMGLAARQRVIDKFSIPALIQQTTQLYRDLLQESQRADEVS